MKRSSTLLSLFLLVVFLIGGGCSRSPKKPTAETPPPLTGKILTVYTIDVGQGDSLLIVTPDRKTVLIDAGLNKAGERVVAFLREKGISTIDLFVASHPHADHIGGVRDVLNAVTVKNVLDSGQEHPTVTYTKMLEMVKEKVGKITVAKAGQKFNLDNGITLSVLGPRLPWLTNVSGSEINANSVILRLDYGKFSMLFTGDSEDETEGRLIEDGANLKVSVLKVAHHGSRYATKDNFLRRVQPEAAVVSCGIDNDYGHPNQSTLDRLRALGVNLHRTDLEGDIAIASNGEQFQVSGSHPPTAEIWTGRTSKSGDDSGSGDLFNNTPAGKKAKRAVLGR
jgi:beta-lactamase superfamily II metal-dependent hydrolase